MSRLSIRAANHNSRVLGRNVRGKPAGPVRKGSCGGWISTKRGQPALHMGGLDAAVRSRSRICHCGARRGGVGRVCCLKPQLCEGHCGFGGALSAAGNTRLDPAARSLAKLALDGRPVELERRKVCVDAGSIYSTPGTDRQLDAQPLGAGIPRLGLDRRPLDLLNPAEAPDTDRRRH